VAALIAAILAPTDLALGFTVVTDRAVPVRVRRALNVESGLNDGIATPFVTLFLLVVAAEESVGAADWVKESLKEVGIALLVGVAIGALAGRAMVVARRHGWTTKASEELAVLALALVSYGASVSVGGNGFVAAFVGGIVFGAATKRELTESTEFAENVGLFSSFLVWALFGAFIAGPTLRGGIDVPVIAYALLSLSVVRMAPVAVALLGTKWRPATVAFVGWFGPRGLASVVFLLIAVEDLHWSVTTTSVAVVTLTIVLSVVLHSLSAVPLARAYGKLTSRRPAAAPELAGAPELRLRRRDLSSVHDTSNR
jgi:NhaP-type Na+/H+ or K+/H+ antiporter